MSAFLTPVITEQIRTDRFRLVAPLTYESDLLRCTITAPTGFVTDLESVPRWLPVVYAWLRGTAHAPGVLHDWAYQTHRAFCTDLTRAQADALLYEAAGATGPGIEALGWAKRWTLWTGVRIGGASAWASGPRRLQAWERRRTPRSAREGDPPQDPSPCF